MGVAGVTALFGRWNTAEDTCQVGRDGSDVRKALDMAPVLLTVDGIVQLNTLMRMLFWAMSGLMRCNVCLLDGRPRCQAVLFLLT